ncbi:MAG: hypothetical protein A2W91_17905 [Bacteroidetes bacterium GWF2_38_335]|nr:MAG: hypothetical protein A2W91_17905 [Bacteroidetes bacterium GWF2_38_335]OFY80152.1 MAG: hypothetical protein A2281_12735 [Bacteroidetes bacterium RIFOXYA12_FULL_38_20]HBS88519.1 hypothetical protein [Bacteroidales bacterium]
MKLHLKILLFFIVSLALLNDSYSQIVVEESKYDEFVLDNKIYKPYSNWLSLNVGIGYNFHESESLYLDDSLISSVSSYENNISLYFHFRIKDLWFNAGYHHSSEEFFLYRPPIRIDELFIGFGFCKDEKKYHLSGFVSPSFCVGNYYNPIPVYDSTGSIHKYYLFTSYRDIGINIKTEFTYKIFYDFGLGISAYATLNRRYPLFGLQLHAYFSGAFKGNVN